MRRKRKHLALIAACSLAVTTTLPGAAYAAVPRTGEDAPQVTDVRILKERNYLEIRWDQEVQNSVDPDNYILKNGDTEFQLLTGNWNTMYFDGYAFSSIGFEGTVDESEPITLEIVDGNTIQDEDGNGAEHGIYDVDYENYYTQFYTSQTGIVVKASDNVQASSLEAAADQIDHMLGKTETGIAARMAEYGASMALYGPDENAYFIPEHRNAWDPDMVLAPQDSGTSAGTRVMLVTGNEEDQTQLWCLEDADGSARFINKVSGLAIGIANDDMTSGNSLVLTEKSDSSIYQLWNVINKTTSATLEQPDTVTTSSDSAVQTGDTTNLIIPFAFMFASAAAVIWLTVKRNRFRQER